MAFIPHITNKIGTRVRLITDVRVLGGVFEKGTELTIIDENPRGYDLVDDEGNNLLELDGSHWIILGE